MINAAHVGVSSVQIAQVGFTSTAFVATTATAALPGELKRLSTIAGEVVGDSIVHVTIRDDSSDAYDLRGFAFYLDDGTLFASYGQATPITEKSAQALILLSADIKFEDLDVDTITFGDSNWTNPPATTERLGVVELATSAEVQLLTDPNRVPSVAALKPLIDDLIAQIAGKAALGHTHDAAAIVSGILAAARIPGLDASKIITGVLDPARIPVIPSQVQVMSDGTLADLTVPKQAQIGMGTVVTTTDGRRWVYTGTGGKTLTASYVEMSDVTPEWAAISNKPATFAPSAHTHVIADITGLAVLLTAAAPAGIVQYTAAAAAPAGWLICDGSLASRATYAALFAAIGTTYGAGDGVTTFRLPDLRGEFIRGLDGGRGVDVDRTLGSFQADSFKAHTHTIGLRTEDFDSSGNSSVDENWPAADSGKGSDPTIVQSTQVAGVTGGTETRPRNVALTPIIKT
jgi:microcystin-dependent protein